LDDSIERCPIHNQISDDRKRFSSPRLNPDLITILEGSHMELTGGGQFFATVGAPIDNHRTATADTFSAIVRESDGVFTL
jgi:hypothetical protein